VHFFKKMKQLNHQSPVVTTVPSGLTPNTSRFVQSVYLHTVNDSYNNLAPIVTNCPTICNTKQSVYYSASLLYMFRVSTTPIIRSTQNCNYSPRYWSYFLCSYLYPTWPNLATLEGGSCTTPEAVVTVLCTPDDGCG